MWVSHPASKCAICTYLILIIYEYVWICIYILLYKYQSYPSYCRKNNPSLSDHIPLRLSGPYMEARHMVYTLVVAQRFEVSPMTSHDFWSRLCFTARARCHYVPKKLAVQFSRLKNKGFRRHQSLVHPVLFCTPVNFHLHMDIDIICCPYIMWRKKCKIYKR